jgi:uncharacterized protein (DUF433 family)
MLKTLRVAEIVPLGIGYYTVPEAGRLLKTEPRNIVRWLGGYSYKRGDGTVARSAPLWSPQLPRLGDALEIGFLDLIELRFVVAFVKHQVGLNVIRRCLENARRIIGEERPFSTHRFRTDGKSIYFESLQEADEAEPASGTPSIIDLNTGQMVFKQVVEPTFRDLDLADGSVVQWRPYKGKPSLVIDPKRSFGKPLAADYGVPTEALASAARAEESPQRAAGLYAVPFAVVNDAIAFEQSLMGREGPHRREPFPGPRESAERLVRRRASSRARPDQIRT